MIANTAWDEGNVWMNDVKPLNASAQSWKTPICFIISVHPSIIEDKSVRFLLIELLWNLIFWTFIKICREIPDFFTIQQNIRHCTWRTKCVILLAATLYLHKTPLLELVLIRIRRNKPHAKLPQCCIIRILSLLVKTLSVPVPKEENLRIKIPKTTGFAASVPYLSEQRLSIDRYYNQETYLEVVKSI